MSTGVSDERVSRAWDKEGGSTGGGLTSGQGELTGDCCKELATKGVGGENSIDDKLDAARWLVGTSEGGGGGVYSGESEGMYSSRRKGDNG